MYTVNGNQHAIYFNQSWAPGTIPTPFVWISGPITLDQAGEWQIIEDKTIDGKVVLSLYVSFLVLPEAIIGAIAVIGSTLGIAAYRYRKYI
jgi:hypothetical protein